MDTNDLRVLFVVDAIKGRNGVGTYFQDLVSHIEQHVAHVELISPSLDELNEHQGLAVPMFGDPTQKLYLPKMRALTNSFFRIKPHVVVIPGPGIFSLAGYWLAKKMGIPVCVTYQTDYSKVVGMYWRPFMANLVGSGLNWINRLLFRGSHSVLTINQELVRAVRQMGIPNPTLVATPMAQEFIQTPVTPHSTKLRQILFVGRLAAEKNIHLFLELAKQRQDLMFTVVGDGPLRTQVIEYAHHNHNLNFLGWQPRQAVIHQLDHCDLLILPSSIEAFGTVALEAMARQRLVLTAPACGINQWHNVKDNLIIQAEQESLSATVLRLEEAMVSSKKTLKRTQQAREVALSINQQAINQWLSVLEDCARHRLHTVPRRSPTLAMLRRLS